MMKKKFNRRSKPPLSSLVVFLIVTIVCFSNERSCVFSLTDDDAEQLREDAIVNRLAMRLGDYDHDNYDNDNNEVARKREIAIETIGTPTDHLVSTNFPTTTPTFLNAREVVSQRDENTIVRVRADVDAQFLYRISSEVVNKMRQRMPREIALSGDAEAEARFASSQCESTNGGISLNFLFDFFDTLLDAFNMRAYDDQVNRMYQINARKNTTSTPTLNGGDSTTTTTNVSSRASENNENKPVEINVEDAFYMRAKSFYLANNEQKKQSEKLHRALGRFEDSPFTACPLSSWTWLFSFFPYSGTIAGTDYSNSGTGTFFITPLKKLILC